MTPTKTRTKIVSGNLKAVPDCQLSYGLTENVLINSRYVPPDLSASVPQWKVKQCALSESYRAHRLLAVRVLGDGNVSRYCFLLPSESARPWVSRDEEIHVLWDEGQILKVIDQQKQPQNSRFYSLVLFTKPYEKRWKRSSHCFVSQHFFTWGLDQKIMVFDLHWFCNEKENQIFFMLLRYKLNKKINLTWSSCSKRWRVYLRIRGSEFTTESFMLDSILKSILKLVTKWFLQAAQLQANSLIIQSGNAPSVTGRSLPVPFPPLSPRTANTAISTSSEDTIRGNFWSYFFILCCKNCWDVKLVQLIQPLLEVCTGKANCTGVHHVPGRLVEC